MGKLIEFFQKKVEFFSKKKLKFFQKKVEIFSKKNEIFSKKCMILYTKIRGGGELFSTGDYLGHSGIGNFPTGIFFSLNIFEKIPIGILFTIGIFLIVRPAVKKNNVVLHVSELSRQHFLHFLFLSCY